MALVKGQRILVACVTAFACLGVAASASSQTIGAPRVTVLANNAVFITYSAPSTPPGGTILAVTYNGAPLANILIGTATAFGSNGPVPAGLYTVQVIWGPSARSDVVGFIVPAPGGSGTTPASPVMHPAVVSGNSVFLSWDPIADATSYEIEAFGFATGQRLILPVAQASATVTNVPPGNYGVRVRARNAVGFGGFSNQVLVAVLTTFRLRDMEVTLTWNTESDIDLHVIEPNGTHVWWRNRNGVTVFLDRDDTTGFGPEVASIPVGGSAPGIYQVFIVHYRRDAPTTSTVSITLGVGTANPFTRVFTRHTEEGEPTVGINVALVDPRSGIISEQGGTRPTAASDGHLLVKP